MSELDLLTHHPGRGGAAVDDLAAVGDQGGRDGHQDHLDQDPLSVEMGEGILLAKRLK